MSKTKEKLIKKSAAFVGRRTTQAKKIAYFWQWEGEEDASGYMKQLVPGAQIGEVFEFTLTEQGGVFKRGAGDKSPKPAGKHKDGGDIKQWIADDIAAVQYEEERRAERAMQARDSDFDRLIAPLADLVNRARSHTQRAAIIANITARLWRS